MTKQKKLILIIVSCILAVALITTAVLLIIANSNREKTETSIMSCSVNPSVQFVLNGNDKVMRVIALNNDGEEISMNGEFVGLKADKAAELFIKLSTEAGHIDIDSEEGTRVDITLTGLKDDYTKLKNQVVASVNKYFDDNGIIAGAVAKIDEDIKNTITKLKSTAQNMDNKSDAELMEHYMAIVELIDDSERKIKAIELNTFFTGYDRAVETYQNAMNDIADAIEEIQAQLAGVTDSTVITELNRRISTLQGQESNKARSAYITALSNLYKNIKITDDYIQSVNNRFETNVNAFADDLAAHRAAFNTNKAATQAKIDAYRATLNA